MSAILYSGPLPATRLDSFCHARRTRTDAKQHTPQRPHVARPISQQSHERSTFSNFANYFHLAIHTIITRDVISFAHSPLSDTQTQSLTWDINVLLCEPTDRQQIAPLVPFSNFKTTFSPTPLTLLFWFVYFCEWVAGLLEIIVFVLSHKFVYLYRNKSLSPLALICLLLWKGWKGCLEMIVFVQSCKYVYLYR